MNINGTKKEENSNYCVFVILITLISFSFVLGYNFTALNSLSPSIEVFINESYQLESLSQCPCYFKSFISTDGASNVDAYQCETKSLVYRYDEPPTTSTATVILNLAHSCLLWGSLAGSLLLKLVSRLFSHRFSILIVHIIAIFSAVLMGPVAKYSNSYECLIIGRFTNGIARSLGLSLVMIFVAGTTCRRRLGYYLSPTSTIQFISCAMGVGMGHSKVLGTPELWMWSVCIPIVMSVAFIVCWPWITESPVYLLRSGKENEALIALKKLRIGDVKDEFEVLKEEVKSENEITEVSVFTMLRKPHLRFQFFTALISMVSPQIVGIPAISMYSNAVLHSAGIIGEIATYVSIGIFLQCILSFAFTAPLQLKFGTKKIFTTGLIIVSASYALFIISDKIKSGNADLNVLIIFSMFLLMFGLQFGPLFTAFALSSELTTANSRPTVVFYSQCVFWFVGGMESFIFPYTSEAWGSYSFLPFLLISVALIPFSLFAIPETHKRTTVEIQKSFRKKTTQNASEFFRISRHKSKNEIDSRRNSEETQSVL